MKSGRILKPSENRYGYLSVKLFKYNCNKILTIHRLAANAFIINPENKPQVDHVNNDKKNNNLSNLRWSTNSENGQNMSLSKRNTSSVKGISFNKRANKWHSQIMVNGRKIHLGYYDNLDEAKNARIKKANQAFGIFTNICEKR